jgi:hypothetical protein
VFGLKAAAAGVIELGLASRLKPFTILKQAGFDP